MSSGLGFSITKPVSVWNKPLKADFKELFKSLGKAAVDGALGKWDSLATDGVEAVTALGLEAGAGEIAWLLIYYSLKQAMFSLVEGNRELLIKTPNKQNLEQLYHYLDLSLENMELHIDQDFFKRPKDLSILEAIKISLTKWLEGCEVNASVAKTISDRLPTYFVFALHQEWSKHPEKYACLKTEVDTPFTQASEKEQAWQRYSAWLQKQVEKPMFSEAFSLKQVYVPLNAYYERTFEGDKDDEFEQPVDENEQAERVVVDLKSELETWLKLADKNDAIRVISGGPGSGKSSFTKIFAANLAEKGLIHVLFIPLHLFEPSADLVDAVGKFVSVNPDRFLPKNPLETENLNSRLLIIFDGLDELAMQGNIAKEVAQNFVSEVQRKIYQFNFSQTHLQVLISGRDLSIQANSHAFRKPEQILHIIPYFVTEQERNQHNYIDAENLLLQDKRQIWWQYYGKVSAREYSSLPPELDQGKLIEITSQPLLNYLVALSFVRGKLQFSQESNLNAIYDDLLKAVYERGWANYQHPSLRDIQEKDFIRILEEIALASWHGDGRTTTVKEIRNHCDNSGLKRLLSIFQEGAELGVTRLLTAFYFRQSGVKEAENTFEFTHKSFGEYLTAKRILREVRLIHKKLKDRQNDPDEGWDEREALTRWAILCGASAMNEYLFHFVVDEMRLQNPADVGNWQQTLCCLIDFMLRYGMPMERLNPRPNFHEENRQARNAEEALLAVLNACARVTKKISNIEWNYPEAFGIWISRLQGQRVDKNVFCLKCLSFISLQKCILYFKDFTAANLEGTNFQDAKLHGANLEEANLKGANFEGAILRSANLLRANLYRANLEKATLDNANLVRANLEEANLTRANLSGANLDGVNLGRANLLRAKLGVANLRGANLGKANLRGANLGRAILRDANLGRANLSGASLDGANLNRSNLNRANLDEANLRGANLEGANLEGANLDRAILREANLERANLKGTIIEGKDLKELKGDLGKGVDKS